jgi:pyruvate dehydrogenase E1 component alpha subunit
VDIPNGILGASAVVGTTIPVATGYALAMQNEARVTGHQRVVVALCGDGGTEEGCFYESINFAALRKLPIIFICENNRLAIHTPIEKRWATERLCERIATYGIKTYKIDDADIFKIHDTVSSVAAGIRKGTEGPVFIECATYRWFEHVGPQDDHSEDYRNTAEYQAWKENDQIERLGKMLEVDVRARIENDVKNILQAAEEFADKSPYPDAEELYTHVYAN